MNLLETVQSEVETEEPAEGMMVNIWKNVEGELRLTEQKPVSRTQFDEMQSRNDFSGLL